MLLNCHAGDFLRVPWTARRSNQSILKYFIGRTDVEAEAPILWPPDAKKRRWCWERLKAKGEEGGRGWDGWMASPTQCTWIWASSGRQRRTEEPGVLQFMESQRVGHDVATEQQQNKVLRVKNGLPINPMAFWHASQSCRWQEFQLQHQSFQWTPRTDLL